MKRLSPILSDEENQRFEQLDQKVRIHLKSAMEWAEALFEIKEGRLWRGKFDSYHSYLEDVGFTEKHASRLVRAAQFKQAQLELVSEGKPAVIPTSVEHAEALKKEQAEPITPAALPDPLPRVAAEPPAEAPAGHNTSACETNLNLSNGEEPTLAKRWSDRKAMDCMGYPVAPTAWTAFSARAEMLSLHDKLANIKFHVEQRQKDKSAGYRWLDYQHFIDDLSIALTNLKESMPYAVCPYCQGRTSQTCKPCRQTGVVTKFFFERQMPEELRKFRDIELAEIKAGK